MKLLTALAIVALSAGPALAADWRDDYQVIKFGILSGENEKDRLARTEPLRAYLEKELGVKVEIFTAGNYDGVIQAMAANQIEAAQFGSSSYAAVYTETNGGVTPILTTIKKDGNTGYHSIVVTRCDSGIKNFPADAKGKVHAFADPDSTSGYAVPYYNFVTKLHIDPTTYFSAIPFGGSHEADVTGVVNGTFNTASTYQNNDQDGAYQRMETKGMIQKGVICKVWESPEITSGPWTVRNNLPQGLIDALTTALLDFPKKDPQGYATYSSFDATDPNPSVGFTRVNHERYQWIVDMRNWLKKQRRGG